MEKERLISKEDQFTMVTEEMNYIFVRKNHDYGNSFDISLNKFGSIASVVRLGDKMNRLETLTKKEAEVQEEAVRDTLLDMANYCVMTIMWLDEQRNLINK